MNFQLYLLYFNKNNILFLTYSILYKNIEIGNMSINLLN